ncbi:MAG: sigma-70 family RNA polymerase sigma factor [bacterium]
MRNKTNWPSVRRYLREIKEYPPLSVEEEFELAQRIQEGDQWALEKLIKANLRFVVAIAYQYQERGLPLPDLISEGNLGLIKAAQRFNASLGFKFITYAVWWIRQSILLALGEHGRLVRVPLYRLNEIREIRSARQVLEQRLEREPSLEELAQNSAMTTRKTLEILLASAGHVSLDMPGPDQGNASLLDQLGSEQQSSPETALRERSMQVKIEHMISTLPSREAEIIRMYFGLNGGAPQTLKQLAARYRVTRERMRQIKERALMRLRRQPSLPHRQRLVASPSVQFS